MELGNRIKLALERAGFTTLRAGFRATGLGDENQFYKWCRGDARPELDSLIAIARAAGVSLDWLVMGAEKVPQAFHDWLETPTGKGAEEEARAFLRRLPLHGYEPTTAFYDLAHQAWRLGLTKSADELARIARATERKTGDAPGDRE